MYGNWALTLREDCEQRREGPDSVLMGTSSCCVKDRLWGMRCEQEPGRWDPIQHPVGVQCVLPWQQILYQGASMGPALQELPV
jgi:hypothetical protein